MNHLRDKAYDAMARHRIRISIEDLVEPAKENTNPDEILEKKEQGHLITKAIRNLASRDQEFITLHFIRKFSIKKVAETMKISVNNAYIIKHRIAQRLKLKVAQLKKTNVV